MGIMAGAYIAYGGFLAISIGGSIPGGGPARCWKDEACAALARWRKSRTAHRAPHARPAGIAAANPGLQKLIMALVFPVGLLTVALVGAELYTGNTAFVSTGAGHVAPATARPRRPALDAPGPPARLAGSSCTPRAAFPPGHRCRAGGQGEHEAARQELVLELPGWVRQGWGTQGPNRRPCPLPSTRCLARLHVLPCCAPPPSTPCPAACGTTHRQLDWELPDGRRRHCHGHAGHQPTAGANRHHEDVTPPGHRARPLRAVQL